MRWEQSLFALFDDLEQQAEGLRLAAREVDLAELSQGTYSQVELVQRLRASRGQQLRVRLVGGRLVAGELTRLGADWLLLADATQEWVVRSQAVASVAGLSRSASGAEPSVLDRLPMRALLRRVAATRSACLVLLTDDRQLEGEVGRVGQDFFELRMGEGAAGSDSVVSTTAVAALLNRG